MGYDCGDDCSAHEAGYKWAGENGIKYILDCPYGDSASFQEGCWAYVEEQKEKQALERPAEQEVTGECNDQTGDSDWCDEIDYDNEDSDEDYEEDYEEDSNDDYDEYADEYY